MPGQNTHNLFYIQFLQFNFIFNLYRKRRPSMASFDKCVHLNSLLIDLLPSGPQSEQTTCRETEMAFANFFFYLSCCFNETSIWFSGVFWGNDFVRLSVKLLLKSIAVSITRYLAILLSDKVGLFISFQTLVYFWFLFHLRLLWKVFSQKLNPNGSTQCSF